VKKVSSIKDRIKEFADTTGENKDVFFEKLGVTSANFRGKKLLTGVNADVIEKIVAFYPEIDLYWLITGNHNKKIENYDKNEGFSENYCKNEFSVKTIDKKLDAIFSEITDLNKSYLEIYSDLALNYEQTLATQSMVAGLKVKKTNELS
jgi:hypothetical protein